MQKQQLRNKDVDTGTKTEPETSGRAHLRAQVGPKLRVLEHVSIRRSERSLGTTEDFPGSRWFLDLYLILEQNTCCSEISCNNAKANRPDHYFATYFSNLLRLDKAGFCYSQEIAINKRLIGIEADSRYVVLGKT